MDSKENKKICFIAHDFYIEYESPDYYMVIIVTIDSIPKGAMVFKMPRRCMQFPIYPYLKN